MNDLDKTPPFLAQEASEQALQEKPAEFQKHFPVLEEEQIEEVTGGRGGSWFTCCVSNPRTSSPPTSPVASLHHSPVASPAVSVHSDSSAFSWVPSSHGRLSPNPGSPPRTSDSDGRFSIMTDSNPNSPQH